MIRVPPEENAVNAPGLARIPQVAIVQSNLGGKAVKATEDRLAEIFRIAESRRLKREGTLQELDKMKAAFTASILQALNTLDTLLDNLNELRLLDGDDVTGYSKASSQLRISVKETQCNTVANQEFFHIKLDQSIRTTLQYRTLLQELVKIAMVKATESMKTQVLSATQILQRTLEREMQSAGPDLFLNRNLPTRNLVHVISLINASIGVALPDTMGVYISSYCEKNLAPPIDDTLETVAGDIIRCSNALVGALLTNEDEETILWKNVEPLLQNISTRNRNLAKQKRAIRIQAQKALVKAREKEAPTEKLKALGIAIEMLTIRVKQLLAIMKVILATEHQIKADIYRLILKLEKYDTSRQLGYPFNIKPQTEAEADNEFRERIERLDKQKTLSLLEDVSSNIMKLREEMVKKAQLAAVKVAEEAITRLDRDSALDLSGSGLPLLTRQIASETIRIIQEQGKGTVDSVLLTTSQQVPRTLAAGRVAPVAAAAAAPALPAVPAVPMAVAAVGANVPAEGEGGGPAEDPAIPQQERPNFAP